VESSTKQFHIDPLDGLRAVAILLVIAFHFNAFNFKGGFLGVDVFFVLSGFLITYLLTLEFKATSSISLKSFWTRRAKRLLPGLFFLLVVIAIAEALHSQFTSPYSLLVNAFFTIFYIQNWHILISSPNSYFSNIYSSPLIHTWSLAVEEQFYLIWPLILLALLKMFHSKKALTKNYHRIVLVIGSLALLSYCAMALTLKITGKIDDIYYNSFFRNYEVLTGALLAISINLKPKFTHAKKLQPNKRRSFLLFAGSLVSLIAIVVMGEIFSDTNPLSYYFATPLVCLFVIYIIKYVISKPASLTAKVLSLKPIKFIGKISYSLYLWHWPIIALLTPATIAITGYKLKLLQLTLIVLLSVSSFYLVEQPLRYANYRGIFKKFTILLPPIAVLCSLWFVNQNAVASFYKNAPKTINVIQHHTEIPYKVAFIGDSVMYQESVALSAAFSSTEEFQTVYNAAWPSWGLTEDSSSWQLVAYGVKLKGANTVFAMWTMDNGFLASASPLQLIEYETLFNAFIDKLLQNGVTHLIFLQQPPLPPPNSLAAIYHYAGWNQRGRHIWDTLAQRASITHSGQVIYVTSANALTQNGQFSWFLPSPFGNHPLARARQLDGLHLCPIGAGYWAQATLNIVSKVLNLPRPKYNWWLTSWIHAQRFNQIPGGQPPDQCPDAFG
jgi:peptidoglycan/LPS O-acetylase OafA/YrhL